MSELLTFFARMIYSFSWIRSSILKVPEFLNKTFQFLFKKVDVCLFWLLNLVTFFLQFLGEECLFCLFYTNLKIPFKNLSLYIIRLILQYSLHVTFLEYMMLKMLFLLEKQKQTFYQQAFLPSGHCSVLEQGLATYDRDVSSLKSTLD